MRVPSDKFFASRAVMTDLVASLLEPISVTPIVSRMAKFDASIIFDLNCLFYNLQYDLRGHGIETIENSLFIDPSFLDKV